MKIDNNNSATLSEKSKFKVPFGTVSITPKARKLIDKALDEKWVTRGKYVQEFEEKYAAAFGVKYAVAVSSGTDADAICCASLYDFGAERGDEIIIPALTFIATANSVLQAGFKPVFVDVDRHTLNMDVSQIEQKITDKTRAIMPVHLMGKPADMNAIQKLAEKYNLKILEDAAEAHGAEYHGRKIGAIGDAAAFSLYAAHIVTTIEGGIIITDDERIDQAARSLRNHGIHGKFQFRRIGFSAKMNELEAAVGLGNIEIYPDILATRRRNLLYLIDKFKDFDQYFLTIKEEEYEKIGPHAFSIIVKESAPFTKDEFVTYIEEQGIDSRNLFYSIPTQCESYRYMNYKIGDFPEAEFCSNHGTHIGIHQDLDLEQLDYVESTIKKFLELHVR